MPDHGGKRHAKSKTSDGASVKHAHALPWPIAKKPQKWSNYREGAYSIPSVAAPAAVAVAASTGSSALAWPVADAPRKWTNFREGAFSISAVADVVSAAAPALAWPVADAPRKWNNFREDAYSKPAHQQVAEAPQATGVANAFPWPVADAPRKWTNFRKVQKPKKIVAKKGLSKTLAHALPWPIADAPRKWTNVRAESTSTPTTGVAHEFPWPVADAPRKWSNFREAPQEDVAATGVAHGSPWPVAKEPRKWSNFRAPTGPIKEASTCGSELNRVASGGVILFETSSAKLTDSSYDTLDNLAAVAKSCERVNIVVEGHTDDRGSTGFNQKLSERRAQSVAAYLQGAGVSAGSLSAVGYGESRPAVPNTSPSNMAKNRRIEFSVSGN